MSVATTQGPIFASAPRISAAPGRDRGRERQPFPTADSDRASPLVPLRRQIGFGRRGIIVTNPALFRTPRRHRKPMVAEKSVKRSTLYAVVVGALIVSAGAMGLSAAVDSPRSLMDKNEYAQSRKAIEADARLNLSKCRDVEGDTRELCRAEARADERIRKADLEASYRGTVAAAEDARLERAKARYDVARAKCADQRGEDRLACLKGARAEKAKALAEAKHAAT
jgi:hypothetical protein